MANPAEAKDIVDPTGTKGLTTFTSMSPLHLRAEDGCILLTAVMATSRKPELLVSYLESYLSDIERWLKEWRIAINVSKSTAMLFTRRRIQKPRPVLLFGEPILWVDAARYLGVILDTRLT
jgi:hypothetical protein